MARINVDIYGDKELELYLRRVSDNMKPNLAIGLREVGSHLSTEIKKRFGNYQRGWAKLKRATVISKQRKRGRGSGYSSGGFSNIIGKVNSSFSGDDPLVLYGELKKSIDFEVNVDMLNTVVFSDNPYAAVHEYGYAPKNVPARSYMRLTLWEEEEAIKKIISNRVGRVLGSSPSGIGD